MKGNLKDERKKMNLLNYVKEFPRFLFCRRNTGLHCKGARVLKQ